MRVVGAIKDGVTVMENGGGREWSHTMTLGEVDKLIQELQEAKKIAELCWEECETPFTHTHSGAERRVHCEKLRGHGAEIADVDRKHRATLWYKGISCRIEWETRR